MRRIGYFISKIKRAWSDRTLWDKINRFLRTMIRQFFEVSIGYLSLSRADRRLNLEDGFADHRQKINHYRSDHYHLRRIVAAYKESKKAQSQAGLPFQIRGLWSEWISINFRPLIDALDAGDISILSVLFENFHREQFTIGMGGYDFFVRYRTLIGGLYLRYAWSMYRNKLLSLGFDLRKIRFPLVGNPTGVMLNGNVVSIESLRYAYHAVEMCELLRDIPMAVVAEIGGGYGGQAHQTSEMNNGMVSKYLVFDIPEVAAISSYFLLSAFPDKNIRLFGEGPISTAFGEKYEIAVLPHFVIGQLADSSVDLFYNSCSFSEMDAISAKEYLSIIERVCRRYFLHDNHDTVLKFRNHDGSTSVNVVGSELLPNSVLFKRIFKKPRVHGLPEDRSFIHFEYLYERVR